MYFGGQYGLLPASFAQTLGNPTLLIIPKLINLAAGSVVLGVLLRRWLPEAVMERDRSERLAVSLEQLAITDGMTGLFNRRHFEGLAHAEWARFQRYGRPLSVLMIDIDKFKTINDRFGHDAGDQVIKAIAATCNATKRQTDVVARVGGEEFVLLLPETDESAAEIVAERLRKSIEDNIHVIAGEPVTISIGIAGAALSMPAFEIMLKRADEALYEAKRTGRNRVMRAPQKAGEKFQHALKCFDSFRLCAW